MSIIFGQTIPDNAFYCLQIKYSDTFKMLEDITIVE